VTSALCLGLAVASTWPLAARLGDGEIAVGTEEVATVPLASGWALWWTADRLRHGLAGYWDAPIFFPSPDAFAMSEPMPLVGLVAAPVFWLGGDVAAAAGLVAILALATNGLALAWLARRIGLRGWLPLACAAAGVLLPFAHHELGVLTLVPLGFVVLAIGAGLEVAARPGWRAGLALGGALGASYLVCGQLAVFAALAIGPAALLAAWRRVGGEGASVVGTARALAAAALVLAAIAAPVAVAQHRAAASEGLSRSTARVENGSASGTSWWRSTGVRVLPQPLVLDADPPGRRALFPGLLKLTLAIAAVVWAWRRPGWRRPAVFLAMVAAMALVWSLAPRAGPYGPYGLLRWMPGIAEIRSFWRSGALTQLAVIVLAVLAVHAAREHPWPARLGGRRRAAACAALAVLAAVELWPRPPSLARVPGAEWDGVAAAVRGAAPPGAGVAHLPFPPASDVKSLEVEARAMMVAIRHGRPIANGYSSFFPRDQRALVTTGRTFPAPLALASLERAGIRVLVVELARLRGGRLDRPPPGWREVHRDQALGAVVLARQPSP
jgi:hypothetical protein